jgi:hypothetical protein
MITSLLRSKQLQRCRHYYVDDVLHVFDAKTFCVYKLISIIKKLFRGNVLTAVLVSHSGTSDDIHDTIIV